MLPDVASEALDYNNIKRIHIEACCLHVTTQSTHNHVVTTSAVLGSSSCCLYDSHPPPQLLNSAAAHSVPWLEPLSSPLPFSSSHLHLSSLQSMLVSLCTSSLQITLTAFVSCSSETWQYPAVVAMLE